MNTVLLVTGALAATILAFVVLVEYLILVPMKRNPGAKRLVVLLLAVFLLLLASVLRYFFQDWPFREEVLIVLFWALAGALAVLGRHIWRDQIEGAREYRRTHPRKEPHA